MNIFKLQQAYFDLFYKVKKYQIKRFVHKRTAGYCDKNFSLTNEQKQQVIDFWAPYMKKGKKMPMTFFEFYTQKTGKFSPYYIPMDVYLNNVDEYFNNRDESKYLDNKCYYPIIFKGIKQPEFVVLRIGGLWYSPDMNIISNAEAEELIKQQSAIFAKVATDSVGGKGVAFIQNENNNILEDFNKFIKGIKADIVVQKPLKQHKDIAAIHESSVNTLRIMSLLTSEGVKIYSAILRIGVGGSNIDNASAGGVSCGITEDGLMKSGCYKLNGEGFPVHPTNGFVFDNYKIPSFDKAKEVVIKAHPMIPHFKLVSWDIAINEEGEPVMIEANLAKGASQFHQFTNGPLFGDDTKKILDEVFGKTKN